MPVSSRRSPKKGCRRNKVTMNKFTQQRALILVMKRKGKWKLRVTDHGKNFFPENRFGTKQKAVEFARSLHPDAKLIFSHCG